MEIVIGVLVGVVCGLLSGGLMIVLHRKQNTMGCIRIDRSDPSEEPYIFLELYKGVGDISSRKRLYLDVMDENYISRN